MSLERLWAGWRSSYVSDPNTGRDDLGCVMCNLVAANDVHFLERSHHESHDVMLCIGTGSMVLDEKRMRYVPELYFKTGEEMAALFPGHPEAGGTVTSIETGRTCNEWSREGPGDEGRHLQRAAVRRRR